MKKNEIIDFKELLRSVEKDIVWKSKTTKIDGMDKDDLYQKLVIDLRKHCKEFDPSKSSFRTWANLRMRYKRIDLWRKTKKEFIETEHPETSDGKGLPIKRVVNASESSFVEDKGEMDIFEEIVASDKGEAMDHIVASVDVKLALDKIPKERDKKIIRLKTDGYSFQEIGEGIDHRTGKKIRTGKKLSSEGVRKIYLRTIKKVKGTS